MKKTLGIILICLLWCNVVLSESSDPTFIFTEDEMVPESKNILSSLEKYKSDEIKKDNYWNEPLTKFDYILTQVKKFADKKSGQISRDQWFVEGFEKMESSHKEFAPEPIDVTNMVYFNEKNGKIIVWFTVDNLGKPRNPMKNICESVLHMNVLFSLPQKMRGYTYHNQLLNELYRGDDVKNYNQALEKISNNIVYILSLISSTEKQKNVYAMICAKFTDESEYVFGKWSFKSKR